jgi:mannose-6-phosphate isomerase-like protein (cupin superfamily)
MNGTSHREVGMEHGLIPAIHPSGSGEAFAGAGDDRLVVRLATAGPCPITLVEDTSSDREWAPLHSHPWDELTYVLEGEMEFTIGAETQVGGPGTLVSLPRGVPHTLRVPSGTARFMMLTVGAPSVEFLREVGQVYATGPTLERLLEVASRHGVTPAFDLPPS